MSKNKDSSSGASGRRFRPLRVIITVIVFLLVIAGIYVAYVFASYKRIPDNQQLNVVNGETDAIEKETA